MLEQELKTIAESIVKEALEPIQTALTSINERISNIQLEKGDKGDIIAQITNINNMAPKKSFIPFLLTILPKPSGYGNPKSNNKDEM